MTSPPEPAAVGDHDSKILVFKQTYGIRTGTPIYWRNTRIGSVTKVQQSRETHNVTVAVAVKGADLPGALAAVVVNSPEENSKDTLRIELVPASKPSIDAIPGFGAFEEFWLSRK